MSSMMSFSVWSRPMLGKSTRANKGSGRPWLLALEQDGTMVELEGRLQRAPGAAQAEKCSPCCMDPASFGRVGDRCGIVNTELVFKKEKEGVRLAGPESSWFIKVCSCKTRTSGTDLPLFILPFYLH